MKSNLYGELKSKYRTRKFLRITNNVKECLWQGGTVLLAIIAITYFLGHWMIWFTGGYEEVKYIIQ